MTTHQRVPADWMPPARMQRIICHWTAGAHKANGLDRNSYHILIEGDGTLVRGTHPISANERPAAGRYAAHTRNCNTGSIGVSMCCMGGAGVRESPFSAGPYPMTRVQWDVMVRAVADLCRRYGIGVSPTTVLSHAEVQANLKIAQRGKWDFTRLAFDPGVVGAKASGDRLRREVSAALAGTGTPSPAPPAPPAAPGIRMGTVTVESLNLRRGPGTGHEIRGSMPRGTRLVILGESGDWLNVRTPYPVEGWAHRAYIALD